jgi:hypothetical protein
MRLQPTFAPTDLAQELICVHYRGLVVRGVCVGSGLLNRYDRVSILEPFSSSMVGIDRFMRDKLYQRVVGPLYCEYRANCI